MKIGFIYRGDNWNSVGLGTLTLRYNSGKYDIWYYTSQWIGG